MGFEKIQSFWKKVLAETNLTNEALVRMNQTNLSKELCSYLENHYNREIQKQVFPHSDVEAMTLADIYVFLKMLKTSNDSANLHQEYVNMRYDMLGIYTSRIKEQAWNAYEGLLKNFRSIIMDLRDFSIVSAPFDKFFNLNEYPEYSKEEIEKRIENANRVVVMDKLDGTFIQLSKGIIGTSNVFFSEDVGQMDNEYLDIAKKYFNANDYMQEIVYNNPLYTFMFELVDKRVPNVINYPIEKQGLYLLGARNLKTGEIYSSPIAQQKFNYHGPFAETYNLTLDEVLHVCGQGDGHKKEGFVLDIDGFYVKVKLEEFFLLNRLNGKFSFRTLLDCYKNDSLDDMAAVLVAKQDMIHAYSWSFAEYQKTIEEICKKIVREEHDKGYTVKQAALDFQKNYPHSWFNYLIRLFKDEQVENDYLAFRNESQFEEAKKILQEWKEGKVHGKDLFNL